MEFCTERGLCVGNTYFKHRSLHKYTRVARGQDGVEIKSMINLVLEKRDMLHYVQDVRAVRGVGCKVRLVGAWIKKREVVGAGRIRSNVVSMGTFCVCLIV